MFFKLTKEQAELIGDFIYSPNKRFKAVEGKDFYYVSETTYELVKNNENIKKVDFSKLETVEKIEYKTTTLNL